eukprot:scaffold1761_cov108-Isochrysis_galbana.AAC.2
MSVGYSFCLHIWQLGTVCSVPNRRASSLAAAAAPCADRPPPASRSAARVAVNWRRSASIWVVSMGASPELSRRWSPPPGVDEVEEEERSASASRLSRCSASSRNAACRRSSSSNDRPPRGILSLARAARIAASYDSSSSPASRCIGSRRFTNVLCGGRHPPTRSRDTPCP